MGRVGGESFGKAGKGYGRGEVPSGEGVGEGADGGKGVVGRMGGWPVLLAGRARLFDLVGRADWVAVQSGQGMVKEQMAGRGGSIC